MLAADYRGPRRMRVASKADPVIQHPRDAIVRVTRSCICGSDLHLYNGLVPDTRIGTTFGHEFCGIVEEVGPEVQTLKAGDHVLVPFNIACGQCHFCKQGLFGNCHESNPQATAVGGIFGYSHTAGGYDGGQAEYVRVPYADVGPMPIPDWMDPDDAVLLTDVVPTGYQAAEMGGIQMGDTVVVFALGPIGLCAVAGAKLMGASTIIGVDTVPERLAVARRLGADHVVDFKAGDPVEQIMALTDGRGVDVAIEALGTQSTFTSSLRVLRPGGTLSSLGVYSRDLTIPLDAFAAGLGDKTIVSTLCPGGKERMRRLMNVVASGRLDLKPLVTHRFRLDQIEEAYDLFAHQRDGVLKVAITP
mgnify:CR=1 FL=1